MFGFCHFRRLSTKCGVMVVWTKIFLVTIQRKQRRMVINLCLGIYIAQAEDEEFSVVYAV